MTIEEFRTLVQNTHRLPVAEDGEILTVGVDSQEDQAIQDAVNRYSTRMPLISTALLVLKRGRVQLTAISGWGAGWRVRDVYREDYRLPGSSWVCGYDGSGVPQLTVPTSGEIQVVYTRPHQLNVSGTTIPPIDHEAVAHLAASLCLNQAANFYAQKKNSSIDGDAVDYARLSGEYFMRSRDEMKLYDEHMARRCPKRAATVNWASRSRSGLGRMFQDDRYS